LLPAPRNSGFAMAGQMIWCPSVIEVDGTYHMFASRWPGEYGMSGWTEYSECVRATSTNLLGPYTFKEVVLQKRADNWDNSRVHNPRIVRAENKFVLYYINSANQTGYAVSDSITGPWTRVEQPVMKVSNPAVLVKPDQSIYVFGRLKDSTDVNRGIAFNAPSYRGPYTIVDKGRNLLENDCELEDPTIWWANNQYNILVNDWKGKATEITKAGAQYFSKDGRHYQLVTYEPVFTKTVSYDDGSSETFYRRERPFIYTNAKGAPIALFTACLPTKDGISRVIAQPIKSKETAPAR
jgi:hypothetical protein